MKHIFKLIIFCITMLAGAGVMAQTPVLVPFAGTRPIDTAYAARSLRVDSAVRFVKYGSADTNRVLGVNSNGVLVLRTKGNGGGGLQWSDTATSPGLATQYDLLHTPTLQSVTNVGNATTTDISALSYQFNGGTSIILDGQLSSGAATASGRNWTLPDASGTIPLTVNGQSANSAGAITISVGTGTVTSVGLTMPSAFSVANSPVTTSGTLAITGAGSTSQYIRGDGTLASTSGIVSGLSTYDYATGMPFALPSNQHDASFMIHASAIVSASADCADSSHITWTILNHTDGHGSTWFTGAQGLSSNEQLRVSYPRARKVFWCIAGNDEKLAGAMMFAGPSVDFTTADFILARPAVSNVLLTGNGSGGWTQSPSFVLDLASYNTTDGSTYFNINNPPTNYPDYGCVVAYSGPNNYMVQRNPVGFGSYNNAFFLTDQFGNPVTTNPTTSDIVYVSSIGIKTGIVHAYSWNSTNQFLCGIGVNFWVSGLYELYMVAKPVSSTSVLVRYQTNYDEVEPTTTNYKIYRNTTNNFGSATLIHTGTDGIYMDTGLTGNTLYYYFYVAVTGSGDVNATHFSTVTSSN